ncbi:8842_t:CDS:2 [Cetraspora pellucida]|uniref:8842_t:CDS:1 n=1 Tax=Cetraspora pellucida TaxID=1433469 RepID=A0A9N9GP66_9GLOM|nr:8842_t:CDS:2 [Cetraspora pellucida]
MAYFIKNKLNDYWSILNYDELTRIASVLNPTSKLTTFLLSTKKDAVIISLQNMMNQYKLLALTSTSFVSLISQQTIIPPLAKELELYISTPPISSSIQNAQDFLAIQATSVPCEEAFFIASKILFKLQNRLNSKTAHASLCLKNWINNNIDIKLYKINQILNLN